MKIFRWSIGVLGLTALIAADAIAPVSIFFKWFYPLMAASFIALYRLMQGPAAADRAAALRIVSVSIISFCGIIAVFFKRDLYIDIGLAWSIQAFIGTLAIGKYLEGRKLDD